MEGGQVEYSEDEMPPLVRRNPSCRTQHRGWLCTRRSHILINDHSGILNMTQGLHVDKLNNVVAETCPDNVLKDMDGRSATTPPWQQQSIGKKPFKRRYVANMFEEEDDDAFALDEEDEAHGG